MKSLGPGKVVHTFNPRRQKQADLIQGQPGTEQVPSKEKLKSRHDGNSGMVVTRLSSQHSGDRTMKISEFKVNPQNKFQDSQA